MTTAVSNRQALDSRIGALLAIFVISGVCGLIYESIWSHYIKLFIGHAAYAQTVVLVVFIGGMALGAAAVGRYLHRITSPLIVYAIVEGVIGLFSLAFHKLFVWSTDWAYSSLLPAACAPEQPCSAQWLLAALLILPQSILLGATFPLMTAGVLRLAPANPGSRIALLYFLNSIGAAAGVVLAGFVLVPALGLPGALLSAGLMNIAVAIAAYACGKSSGSSPLQPRTIRDASKVESNRRLLIIVAAMTGLSSFIYEVVWIRMLSVVVGASTHAFELMLAAFILGLALGGLWVSKRVDRFRDLFGALAIVQVLMGLAAVATLALYDGMFDFLAWLLNALSPSEAGYVLYNLASHGVALTIMLPATFLAGMTLPLITTELLHGRDGERALGYVYAANTLGSIIGVIVAVHLALPMLGVKGGLILGAGIDVALGVALLCRRSTSRNLKQAAAWGFAGICALIFVAVSVPVLPERMASGVYRTGRAILDPSSTVVFNEDGKTASVAIVRNPVGISIVTNGKPDAAVSLDRSSPTSDEMTMSLLGVLPLVYRPDAKTAAVVGFGSGMTTTTLLGSPTITQVDTIEIEPQMVRAARLFGDVVEPAFVDPRSRVVIDDAKSYFARSTLRYDVIVSEPSNPWVSGVASLFTQEFYARAKRQLNPDGVFVQWIQVYEFNDELLSTILRAIDAEFKDYVVFAAQDGDLIVLAAENALPQQMRPDVLRWKGFDSLRQRFRLESLDELESRRLAGRAAIRHAIAAFGVGMNSDYFPVVDEGAAKARFRKQTANGLARLAIAPVPIIEMVSGEPRPDLLLQEKPAWPSTRRMLLQTARASASYLLSGTVDGKEVAPLARDVGLLRAILWSCVPPPPRVNISELLFELASYVNPLSTREQAALVWKATRQAKCFSQLDSSQLSWFELIEAVGARDAPAMARLGSLLVEERDSRQDMRAYALMAGMTGYLAEGNSLGALRILATAKPMLSASVLEDLPIRVLKSIAQTDISAQAALR